MTRGAVHQLDGCDLADYHQLIAVAPAVVGSFLIILSGDFIGAQNSPTYFCAPMSNVRGLHRAMCFAGPQAVRDRLMVSPHQKVFLFVVRRNSANFASPGCCKSFAGWRLACGGDAKLSEFRLGGVTKSSPSGAKFALATEQSSLFRISCSKLPPVTFEQLMRFGQTKHPPSSGAHRQRCHSYKRTTYLSGEQLPAKISRFQRTRRPTARRRGIVA